MPLRASAASASSSAAAAVSSDPSGSPMSDRAAVRAILQGRKELFEIIVRRYNPLLRNHARAEDAMQNAYLRAFLNLRRFRGAAAFSTWLTRIMINECLMLLRREKRFVDETLAEIVPIELPAQGAEAPDTLHAEEMKTALEHAIQSLPRNQRTVYLLREVQNLSVADTAAHLGLSPANVKVLLHRAREQLKTRLLQNAAGVELFAYSARYCDPLTAKVMQAVMACDEAER
jgi:RNA polymerase sigma-70 factor (ECF subfamily)